MFDIAELKTPYTLTLPAGIANDSTLKTGSSFGPG